MGDDDHSTVQPSNWDEVDVEKSEQFYQVWLAPTCKSVETSDHLPTFLYIRAIDDAEAGLKAIAVTSMLQGVDCECQIRYRPVEVYV